ncbi:ABC transporter ATP-binding protein [Siccirubricoccus sp. KC 17139]|uniref:ABC transporter ATP-binding protein n=1 Tax=Siccirubricoccus soli TaxID=2899147 RepID=A0ABT1D5I6_9PROT|nr:ABC transporter ATP-binding protein [Siccirubricoccus soli]MCO6416560.1 ABC transporter ATP-binding protein [Siccirubricoccus soli]MCP2682695.1 ABC transporter ATP-binding protein [Siccirubricoccus soli]
MPEPVLDVAGLEAGYGHSRILRGVDLTVGPGEIVGLVGRNGSGRSTALKAMVGLLAPSGGSVRLGGREMAGRPAHAVVRAGLAYVPEDRQPFVNLTVAENLRLGLQPGPGRRWRVDEMFEFFPRLRERARTRAGVLSGGEQQMLALARSLLGGPRVILVDEPTEGLAPLIVARLVEVLRTVAAAGIGILLVEQRLTIVLDLATRIAVLGHGRVVHEGPPGDLRGDSAVTQRWLAVSGH